MKTKENFQSVEGNIMNILGIDTTKKQAYVFGLFNDKKVVDVIPAYEKHSENLLQHIEGVLSFNDIKLSDIDVFANISGPGSFTGIRIGLTTLKALNLPFKKNVVNLSVFEALKSSIKDGVLLLECTQNSVYFCEFKNNKIVKYGVVDYADFPQNWNDEILFVLKEEQLHLNDTYKVSVINNYAEVVLDEIINEVKKCKFTQNCVPFYIALSQAEKALIAKETGSQKND